MNKCKKNFCTHILTRYTSIIYQAFRGCMISACSLIFRASLFFCSHAFETLCAIQVNFLMCHLSVFFVAISSLQAQQNNLLFLTVNSLFGLAFICSRGDMVIRSPFSFPFSCLIPFGGGFLSNRFLQAKTIGVGECNLSIKDEMDAF